MTRKIKRNLSDTERGDGPLVFGYGGGVNTMAGLIQLEWLGERPDAILMADPGMEWPETIAYRDEVANPWLRSIGWPEVTVVTRANEAQFRPRAGDTEQGTLLEECLRIGSLPSIAYGWKKCSQKYKAIPVTWWIERQEWARAAWASGKRITRSIGYDRDEERRARSRPSWTPRRTVATCPTTRC